MFEDGYLDQNEAKLNRTALDFNFISIEEENSNMVLLNIREGKVTNKFDDGEQYSYAKISKLHA